MPGGREEMTFGNENVYNCYWFSSSNKLRKGFAECAYACNVPIIPIALVNVDKMSFAPITYISNKIGITRLYNKIMNFVYYDLYKKNNKCIYLSIFKIRNYKYYKSSPIFSTLRLFL